MDNDLDDRTSLLGVDAAHEAAYVEALDTYERENGRMADPAWRALLYIGTGDPALWAWMRQKLDYRQDRADLRPLLPGSDRDDTELPDLFRAYLNSPHIMTLLELARHLHGGPDGVTQINLAGMIQGLRDHYYQVMMGALREYRGRQ